MRRASLALLLCVAWSAGASAGRPAQQRRFFAPAPPEGRSAMPPPAPAASATGLRRLLHPIATSKAALGAAKTAAQHGVEAVRLWRVEHQIRRGGRRAGHAPSRAELRRAELRRKRWERTGADHIAEELLAHDVLVASRKHIDVPLARADLRRGAAALVDGLRGPGVLLPVDLRPDQVHQLIDLGLSAVAGRNVYGAPDGVADVLRSPLVAYSVVQRTLEAAGSDGPSAELGWLSPAQREVVLEALDGDEVDRARSALERAYDDAIAAALAVPGTYRTEPFRMTGDAGALPLEIQAAIEAVPGLDARLRALEASGVELRIRVMQETPPGVRTAALEYGAFGEETDFGPMEEHVARGQALHPRPTSMGIRRAIGGGRFARRAPPTEADLERRIDLVDQAVDQVLVIEATGARAGSARVRTELAAVNRELGPVRRVMAEHRIVYDVKKEAGEGARAILKKVGLLVVAAATLQKFGANELAILTAEAGEDLAQGLAVSSAEDGQLRTKDETWSRRAKIAAGAALASSAALAWPIARLAEHGLGWVAGPLMGIGSMSLSAVVFFNAVTGKAEGHLARLRAGKVPDTIPRLIFDPDFQVRVRAIDRESAPDRAGSLLVAAREHLDAMVARGELRRRERDDAMDALGAAQLGDHDALRTMVAMPSRRALWKHGFDEMLRVPTGKALFQGMGLTIAASSAVGAVGLLSGSTWGMVLATVASAGEGLWGLTRSMLFDHQNDLARKKALRRIARGWSGR